MKLGGAVSYAGGTCGGTHAAFHPEHPQTENMGNRGLCTQAEVPVPKAGVAAVCTAKKRAKSSTNPPWSALSQPPGSACGGHYIDHLHQWPERRFSAIHGEGGSLDCEISLE